MTKKELLKVQSLKIKIENKRQNIQKLTAEIEKHTAEIEKHMTEMNNILRRQRRAKLKRNWRKFRAEIKLDEIYDEYEKEVI